MFCIIVAKFCVFLITKNSALSISDYNQSYFLQKYWSISKILLDLKQLPRQPNEHLYVFIS